MLGVIYTQFAYDASVATNRASKRATLTVMVYGAASWVGFFYVQHNADGSLHVMGAALFIIFHALMQHSIDNILFDVRNGTRQDRMVEHGITLIMVVAGGVFFGMMVVHWAVQGACVCCVCTARAQMLNPGPSHRKFHVTVHISCCGVPGLRVLRGHQHLRNVCHHVHHQPLQGLRISPTWSEMGTVGPPITYQVSVKRVPLLNKKIICYTRVLMCLAKSTPKAHTHTRA